MFLRDLIEFGTASRSGSRPQGTDTRAGGNGRGAFGGFRNRDSNALLMSLTTVFVWGSSSVSCNAQNCCVSVCGTRTYREGISLIFAPRIARLRDSDLEAKTILPPSLRTAEKPTS